MPARGIAQQARQRAGGRGNGSARGQPSSRAVGFLRAVERDFFVEYVEKPTDNARWRGRLFWRKLCSTGRLFENGPRRRRWKHEKEVQMRAMPRPTQSEFF